MPGEVVRAKSYFLCARGVKRKGAHMQKQGPVVLLAGEGPREASVRLGLKLAGACWAEMGQAVLLGRKLACAFWAKSGLNY